MTHHTTLARDPAPNGLEKEPRRDDRPRSPLPLLFYMFVLPLIAVLLLSYFDPLAALRRWLGLG